MSEIKYEYKIRLVRKTRLVREVWRAPIYQNLSQGKSDLYLHMDQKESMEVVQDFRPATDVEVELIRQMDGTKRHADE